MDKLMSDLKAQIISQLNMQDVKPEDIGDDQPLFVEGLGLDSIDALELIVLIAAELQGEIVQCRRRPKRFQISKNHGRLYQCTPKPGC